MATKKRQPWFQAIPIESIDSAPFQIRERYDEDALRQLAASMQELGLLRPILVRPSGGGRFEIVNGERRFRAAKLLGWAAITCCVAELSDLDAALQQAIEMEDPWTRSRSTIEALDPRLRSRRLM